MLDKSFSEILETLSKTVHNQWMTGRLTAGWKYGHERNDEKKEHPSLIPYEELPEEEKEFDRQTAKTVINYLLNNGYDIIKREQ
jgi:hypothetical protein